MEVRSGRGTASAGARPRSRTTFSVHYKIPTAPGTNARFRKLHSCGAATRRIDPCNCFTLSLAVQLGSRLFSDLKKYAPMQSHYPDMRPSVQTELQLEKQHR